MYTYYLTKKYQLWKGPVVEPKKQYISPLSIIIDEVGQATTDLFFTTSLAPTNQEAKDKFTLAMIEYNAHLTWHQTFEKDL